MECETLFPAMMPSGSGDVADSERERPRAGSRDVEIMAAIPPAASHRDIKAGV